MLQFQGQPQDGQQSSCEHRVTTRCASSSRMLTVKEHVISHSLWEEGARLVLYPRCQRMDVGRPYVCSHLRHVPEIVSTINGFVHAVFPPSTYNVQGRGGAAWLKYRSKQQHKAFVLGQACFAHPVASSYHNSSVPAAVARGHRLKSRISLCMLDVMLV